MQINKSKYFQIIKNYNGFVEGYLRFAVNFLENGQIELGYQNSHSKKYIIDEFYLKIDINNNIPLVYEVGDRIKLLLMKKHVNKGKLHINEDNSCCLGPTPFLIKFFESSPVFSNFIESILIPFFGGLSFYEKQGKRPNQEYSHGDLGLLEYFFELSEEDKIYRINEFEFKELGILFQNNYPIVQYFIKYLKSNKDKTAVKYFLITLGILPFI